MSWGHATLKDPTFDPRIGLKTVVTSLASKTAVPPYCDPRQRPDEAANTIEGMTWWQMAETKMTEEMDGGRESIQSENNASDIKFTPAEMQTC